MLAIKHQINIILFITIMTCIQLLEFTQRIVVNVNGHNRTGSKHKAQQRKHNENSLYVL